MRLITVTALQPHTYEGRAVAVGEVFTVSPLQAAALTYQGKVRLGVRDTPPAPPAPDPTSPRRRRPYKRRDLTAEHIITTDPTVEE